MAGEIQLNSTTMATESSGSITAELDTIRPNTTNGSLTLQGDSSDAGVTGLTIDSSGNATFAQTISGGTLGSSVVFPTGNFIGSAFLAEVTNGDAGTFTASTQTLRNLNTVVFTSNCPITLSSSEFSFDEAGSYIIQGSAPGWYVNEHIISIFQDTGTVFIARGTTATSESSFTVSFVTAKVTISSDEITSGSSEKTFGIYHICATTKAGNGLGDGNPLVTDEQFAQTKIFRVA